MPLLNARGVTSATPLVWPMSSESCSNMDMKKCLCGREQADDQKEPEDHCCSLHDRGQQLRAVLVERHIVEERLRVQVLVAASSMFNRYLLLSCASSNTYKTLSSRKMFAHAPSLSWREMDVLPKPGTGDVLSRPFPPARSRSWLGETGWTPCSACPAAPCSGRADPHRDPPVCSWRISVRVCSARAWPCSGGSPERGRVP